MMNDLKEVLYSEQDIKNICKRLGEEITKYYEGKELVLLCVLKGAVPFLCDLIKEIKLPLVMDFVQLSSYTNTSSGNVLFKKDCEVDVKGKDVLFVEDIIDTGKTINRILEEFENRGANSIEFVTLFDKRERRIYPYLPKFVGDVIPDKFIIGYGFDFNEKYRNLPVVGVLKEEFYK
jgi:hypoxanthine phosphoribosyltransferase